MKLKAAPPALRTLPVSTLAFAPGDGTSADAKRAAMIPSRKWYGTKEWAALRAKTFERDGYRCQMAGCGVLIHNTRKLVCDHIKPHRGDRQRFFDEQNLQTLCKPCHDRVKQRQEIRAGL